MAPFALKTAECVWAKASSQFLQLRSLRHSAVKLVKATFLSLSLQKTKTSMDDSICSVSKDRQSAMILQIYSIFLIILAQVVVCTFYQHTHIQARHMYTPVQIGSVPFQYPLSRQSSTGCSVTSKPFRQVNKMMDSTTLFSFDIVPFIGDFRGGHSISTTENTLCVTISPDLDGVRNWWTGK